MSGTEAALADVVEARLRERARAAARSSASAHNVVARTELGPRRSGSCSAAISTRCPPTATQTPRRDGDVLHGLGTADMKGGLAVLLALADDLARDDGRASTSRSCSTRARRSPTSTTGCAGCSPSGPSSSPGDLAILLEPTGGWVEAGCQGTIHVRATFDGVRAHSARPWMGTNAIHRAAPLLDRSRELRGGDRRRRRRSTYREALQVVRIEGGIANNVVPDRCDGRRQPPLRAVACSLDDAVDEVVTFCTTRAPTTSRC